MRDGLRKLRHAGTHLSSSFLCPPPAAVVSPLEVLCSFRLKVTVRCLPSGKQSASVPRGFVSGPPVMIEHR